MRGIAIFFFLVSFGPLAARTAEIDPCDRLAANPDDPQRVASGAPFFQMDGPAAVEACRTAAERYPDIARFRYQLALALARTENSSPKPPSRFCRPQTRRLCSRRGGSRLLAAGEADTASIAMRLARCAGLCSRHSRVIRQR